LTVNEKKPNLIIKFALRGGIIFFLILAGMRFYSSYLEQKVADISSTIEQLSMQEMSLKQQLSTLKSSNRIYNYCKDTLKMQRSTNVGVINKFINE
jgi:cell division protein FtsL